MSDTDDDDQPGYRVDGGRYVPDDDGAAADWDRAAREGLEYPGDATDLEALRDMLDTLSAYEIAFLFALDERAAAWSAFHAAQGEVAQIDAVARVAAASARCWMWEHVLPDPV